LEIGVVVRRGNWLGEDSGGSLDGGDMGDSIGDGDDASKEGGMRRRLYVLFTIPQQFGFTLSFPGPFGRWRDRRWRLV
jgi:hypothetical protein